MRHRNRDPKTIAPLLAALVPLGLAACDGSTLGEFDETASCSHTENALSDLQPREGVSYVALRSYSDFGSDTDTVDINAEWGERCAGATDPSTCSTQAGEMPIDQALVAENAEYSTVYDVLFTDADGAGRVTTRQELLDLLGAIDTPQEAVLLTFVDGHRLRCSSDNLRREGDNFVLLGTSGSSCGGGDITEFEVTVSPSGEVTKGEPEVVGEGDPNCAIGRRPPGLQSRGGEATGLGDFFSNVAHLEAASVPAFAQLADELRAHGAPEELVARAISARDDEVRHAMTTRRLARRFGGPPIAVRVGKASRRPLFEVALDNATEGCVRETFGALVAKVQATRAQDAEIRGELATIADDETRHAELSWEIDQWIRARLSDDELERLDAAQRDAAATLQRDVAFEWPKSVQSVAGMPDAAASAKMARAFVKALALS